MKILELEYEDKSTGWKLECTRFGDINLLAGPTGVGKTQILKAIYLIKWISKRQDHNGVAWRIKFIGEDGREYQWKGEFENIGFLADWLEKEGEEVDRFRILFEEIRQDDSVIASRQGNKTILNGIAIILDDEISEDYEFESMLFLLKEEKMIASLSKSFRKISWDYFTPAPFEGCVMAESLSLLNKFLTDELISDGYISDAKNVDLASLDFDIRELDFGVWNKLQLAATYRPEIFKQIKDRFISIFPQVEDLKFEIVVINDNGVPVEFRDEEYLLIKERGTEHWMPFEMLSSGLYPALHRIAELYLSPRNAVILINEFENGLGVNCLDEIAKDMVNNQSGLQYILTSNRPYVIDTIDIKNWKLVTRHGGTIRIQDVAELNTDKSKREVFMEFVRS